MIKCQSSAQRLLNEIESFLTEHRISATDFGVHCMNDGHLVRRLRSGGDVTLQTADKIRRFMADYRSGVRPRKRRRKSRARAKAAA